MKVNEMTQPQLLETFLRGTNIEINDEYAKKLFGIRNLRAVMSDLRQSGLKVRTRVDNGSTFYSVSKRDNFGSEYKRFI